MDVKQEVELSAEVLSWIIDSAEDAIIAIDQEQKIVLFNKGAEQMFGYTAQEIKGQPLSILLPSAIRHAHNEYVAQFRLDAVSTKRMAERGKVFGRRKDGAQFPAEASISKLCMPEGRLMAAIVRNVAERKHLEERVKETALERVQLETELETGAHERAVELAAVLDGVPDAMVTTDSSQRIQSVNSALTRIFGYTVDDLIGQSAAMLYPADTDREAVANAWSDWETQESKTSVIVNCQRKDGTVFSAIVLGNVVRSASGNIVKRIGLIRDITDQLTRERALQQAQKMETVGELAGGVAHDFNNLLTVIVGNLELLEPELSDGKAREALDRIQRAAANGANLTQRLLAFSRQQQLDPKRVEINHLVIRTSELLRRSIGEHITLAVTLAPDLWPVLADPAQIESTLTNLAINARDVMPNGGNLMIETQNVRIDSEHGPVSIELKPGQYVALSITDTGAGIPPEIRSRIFEPFFTTKEKGGGTGLGLAMVFGFAKQSGGHITVSSEVGQGTTFTLYLPRASDREQVATQQKSGTAPGQPLSGLVLLVEDDEGIRQLNMIRLQRLGFDVVEAENGAVALDLLRAGLRPNIIFSDVVMPGGVSGQALCEQAKALDPSIRILLTSGYSEEMVNAGAPDASYKLLRKPYKISELADALREVLILNNQH